ncbi:AAA family ATPase [Microbacterium sp. M3]|uniref:AAA family ATPase n=1 Tax=Microbacterium arthrosphaerae TaxID=792652 RepID=A0ABU4GWE7_9MICO|nr:MULTISPECIES: AAA family ATPase [Microbacterium]MDW4571386.1 AAA family ATPase [Microbacterium arthrosphaerae]MDW7605241.1 AAA family ATPase [Microbacterium sp. M3]
MGAEDAERGYDVTPGDLGLAEPDVTVVHVAEPERDRLRLQSAALGGRSTLLHFADGQDAAIEITKAHPGSLPQFITGRSTLLSNLFRDEVALRNARLAAARITSKDQELRTTRGLDAVRLTVGLATWRIGGLACSAPVLLRPLAIRRHHGDFELKLHGAFSVNPELVRAMRTHFGIAIDAGGLAALAYDGGVFKPQPVIDHLRALTAGIDSYAVKPRLLVSTFADVGAGMAADAADLDHRVLNALAGHVADRESLTIRRDRPVLTNPDERPPAADTLLLDADSEQERVLARIADGQSLVVHTLPGTGGTQTVINAVGALVRDGKRVLVVSARRSTLDGVRHRLAGIGLPGLAVSPDRLQRDLIRAIGRNEKAEAPKVADIDDALVRLRGVLRDYRSAVTARHPSFGVSVLDILRELATLAARGVAPVTEARFDAEALERLAATRHEAAAKLASAARLGEFRFGPDDSPWYGVSFATVEQARGAHALAGKLHRSDVPTLLERGYELIAQTRMRPFRTVAELGVYLRLLRGIRDSLDKFSLTVFERPLGELIQAHAPRRDAPEMNGANRRRLRRLSREYLRPGVHVPDMYEALVRVQQQRTEWQRYVDPGVTPEIPLGLSDVQVAWQRVDAELGELDAVLGRSGADLLATVPVKQLVRILAGLAADSDVFDNLKERATLRAELAAMGLEPLLLELSVRHVPEDQVAAELEYAWWQSALELLLRTDRAVLGANTAVVDRLERDFRLVDEAHAAASGPLLAAHLATQWRIGIVDHAAEADGLKRALKRGAITPGELARVAPVLSRTLAPVWLASPYEVPRIPDAVGFDVVVLADAGALCLAEAAPALRRAGQVVAFGDPVTQKPTPFRVAAGPATSPAGAPASGGSTGGSTGSAPSTAAANATAAEIDADDELPFDVTSVFERLAELLPVETLTRSYRAGGEDLAALVNDAFYGGELVSLPWAGSYLGRGSLAVDYVEGGHGTPDPITGAVESPDSEVARVVTLVVEHAVNRGSESLMVVTASARHAERIRGAVEAAFAGRSDVADFVSRDTAEPFSVLTLEESVAESRDRVIFSLGFGLTKHGRVLSDFGDLSSPDGERLLTVGMTRARRSMVIVSSIRPSAFDDGRLEYGAATLMSILGGIAARSREARLEDLADPLTRALARELRRVGLSVDVHYRGLLPLVAQYDGKAVVVESDPETIGESLRESLRLRPQILRRLGWHYVRVHSFDLYRDPADVAQRIAAMLGVPPDAPRVDSETQPIDVVE